MENLREMIGTHGRAVDELVTAVVDFYGEAGVPIVQDGAPRERAAWEANDFDPILARDRTSADIWARKDAAPSSLFHEAQHLHRYYVEGVEELQPVMDANATLVSHLENELEHVFLVPEEIRLFPQAKAYWAGKQQTGFHAINLDFLRSYNLAKNYIVTQSICPDAEFAEQLRIDLQALGKLGAIEELRNDYANRRSSKLETARGLLREAGLGAIGLRSAPAG